MKYDLVTNCNALAMVLDIIMYTVHYTLYTVQCTMYSIYIYTVKQKILI